MSLAPVADPGTPEGGAYAGDEGSPIHFDGTDSSDPEGSLLTYYWDFGDDTTSNEPAPSHTYADYGAYVVTLVVLDEDDGASPEATIEPLVANVAPDVDAGPDAAAVEGEPFVLSATFSDPGSLDGPSSWSIDWGDGTSSTGTVADQGVPAWAGLRPVVWKHTAYGRQAIRLICSRRHA